MISSKSDGTGETVVTLPSIVMSLAEGVEAVLLGRVLLTTMLLVLVLLASVLLASVML